ncbi:MAG TPA: DUF1580 domain-containing protein [Pirellulales bacterium]|jgi:hypothetical protein|nr:DUF1580 domain-containing protein [Pirellulales bacterium]
MTIDYRTHTLLTFAQAAASLPHRPHASTCFRWSTRGIRGIRLATIQIGGILFTSEEALQHFFEELNAKRIGEAPPVAAQPKAGTTQRQAAHRLAVKQELQRLGV